LVSFEGIETKYSQPALTNERAWAKQTLGKPNFCCWDVGSVDERGLWE